MQPVKGQIFRHTLMGTESPDHKQKKKVLLYCDLLIPHLEYSAQFKRTVIKGNDFRW